MAESSPESLPAAVAESLALRTILLPRDTNGSGIVFGGVILSQIDLAGAAIARHYACHRFVTVAMKEVKFIAPVYVGDVVSYFGRVLKVGNTSITVQIRVEAERFSDCTQTVEVTSAEVVYVAVDQSARPIPVRPH
ncbi:MAG: acyl-CoA thioesterase [Myxococcales bacterium]|nr:acyl-CoA thioesterase [Myxococcales bacterium]